MGRSNVLNTQEIVVGSNRSSLILLFCLGTLLIYQIRFPGQSYPTDGINQVACLITIILVTLLIKVKNKITEKISLFSPAIPAALFLIYAIGRWIAAGSPYWGVSTLNGWVIAAMWGIAFSNVISIITISELPSTLNKVFRYFGYLIAGICILSILHGFYQFFYAYDANKALLLRDIGSRPPTDIEVGLLHHFTIKRVASIWGDPNIFALITVIAFTWALVIILSAFKERKLALHLGAAGFLLISAPFSISITGSRGGVLDLLLAAGIVIFYYIFSSNRNRNIRAVAVVPIAFFIFQTPLVSQTTPAPSETSFFDRFKRSDTIRERLNYFRVAGQMIKLNPLFGLGPGATEGYFGQFKTSETRESKYIHNWVMQITAELGFVGLILLLISVGLIVVQSYYRISEFGSGLGVWIFSSWLVILFDGLFQLSFYQREILVLLVLFTVLLLSPTGPRIGKRTVIDSRIVAFPFLVLVLIPFLWCYVIPSFKGKHYEELATEAWKVGETSEALKFYGKAISVEPTNPTNYIARSRLYLAANNVTAATLDAKSAIKVQPLSARAHANLAEVYLKSNQKAEALQAIDKAIELYPYKDEYRYIKSQIHTTAGEKETAIEEARLAVEYSQGLPGHKTYQNHLNSLTK